MRSPLEYRRPGLLAAALAVVWLATAPSTASAAEPSPGWRTVDLPAPATFFIRYLPAAWDPLVPAPLIVFLHGAGSSPSPYKSYLTAAADATGAVIVAPYADAIGWGTPRDEAMVAEAVRQVQAEVAIDPERIALAGHSAGGAYAYLLAYGQTAHWSAVFTLAASYYPVTQIADPGYTAPIRMFYGTSDPNYVSAYPSLVAQWQALGVPWTEDVQAGFGHSTWPPEAMLAGFEFLVAQRYPAATCTPSATTLCLLQGRFRVEIAWQTAAGGSGFGQVPPDAGSDSAGLFWFFAPANWEMLVKTLDGCGVNGHYWVFETATTNVAFTMTVTDTLTQAVRVYTNPQGRAAVPIQDTGAFLCD